jgi:diadenosine tetraphosphate (Ap4A) HIT family hydrolase
MKLYSRKVWENSQQKYNSTHDCIFCTEKSDYYIDETLHWRIIHNKFPILGMKEHIMAIPKKHYTLAKDIPDEVFLDYRNVEKFVSNFYGNINYFTFMRETISGRSIEHIHYHFLPGMLYYNSLEKMLEEQGFTNQLDSD